jgi:UDP-glucose 4-epimerase
MQEVLTARGTPASLPLPEHGPARPGDLRSNMVDPALAATVLGWRPEVALADGLARTARWFAGD